MLDVYRFILSLCVVQGHLLPGIAPWLAWQAVFSFYVLSGFLMSLILNKDYGFTTGGFVRFAVNRWLRLFPIYYIVIGITVFHIAFIGPLNRLNAAIALPATFREIAANILVITLPGFDAAQMSSVRLSPTAWSLGVELASYLLLAVYFAKSRRRLMVMLTLGVGLTAVQLIFASDRPDYGLENHYSVLQAGLIPFAAGGLCYFYRDRKFYAYSATKLAIVVAAFAANAALGYWSDFHRYVSGLYIAVALNIVLVPMMFRRPATSDWQKMLGGLSYPLFLCHWLVATLLTIYLPKLHPGSFALFAVGAAASVLFSMLLYYAIDRPVQRIRSIVKRPVIKADRHELSFAAK